MSDTIQKYIKDPGSAITHFIGMLMAIFAFNKLGNLLRIFVEPRVMSGEKD